MVVVGGPVVPEGGAELAGHGRAEEALAGMGRPDRVPQHPGRRVLEEVAVRPHLHRLHDVLRVVVHAEDEDAGGMARRPEFPGHLETRPIRHGHVEDDHVRLEPLDLRQGLGARSRLAHHVEPRRRVQHRADPLADDGVVVGHQDPDGIRHGGPPGPAPGPGSPRRPRRPVPPARSRRRPRTAPACR